MNSSGIKVNGASIVLEHLLIVGNKIGSIDTEIKIGLKLTDGNMQYEIIGIPFVRYNDDIKAMKENISVELKKEEIDENELIGKILYIVESVES